jgi:diaminopimelate epimerase
MGEVRELTLSKYHGLGNDFLLLVDRDASQSIDADLARRLCDRHRGIGADGLIRLSAVGNGSSGGQAAVRMELLNADGSQAEMSGNGIRCVAQAAHEAGMVEGPSFVVETPAGPRAVTVREGSRPGTSEVSVEMGEAIVGPEIHAGARGDHRARLVDMGNPHMVVITSDVPALDVCALGSRFEADHGSGVNVEFMMTGPGPGDITIRTWERGVGETLACGTGSAAAAAAARTWGLVGEHVRVHNPGGPLEIDLHGPQVVLTGPAELVGRVEVGAY